MTGATCDDGSPPSAISLEAGETVTCVFNNSRKKGDLNGDNMVDLTDAIIALQVITGLTSPQLRTDYAVSGTDVNGDDQVGMEELVYILEEEAEVR